MSMKTYVAKSDFNLSALVNPALSMGITVKKGSLLKWDGYNFEYNGIKDASLLKPAVDAGWLAEADPEEIHTGKEQDSRIHLIQKASESSDAPDSSEEYLEMKKVQNTGANNSQRLYSENGPSVMKNAEVVYEDSTVVKNMNLNDAGSKNNVLNNKVPERAKMAVINDEEGQVEIPLKGNREEAANDNVGSVIKMSAKATTAKNKPLIEDGVEEVPSPDGLVPMRRKVPSKFGVTRVEDVKGDMDKIIDYTPSHTLEAKYSVDHKEGQELSKSKKASRTEVSSSISGKKDVEESIATQNVPTQRKVLSSKIKEEEMTPRSNKEKADKKIRIQAEPEPPKEKSTKNKSKGENTTPDPILSLTIKGKPWKSVKSKEKIDFVKSLSDKNILEGIRVHKNSHWSVRRAAKERAESIS